MRAVCFILAVLAAPLSAEEETRARALIAQLGADGFAEREAAQAELQRLCDSDESGSIDALLFAASRSEEPEVSARARRLVASIRAWERVIVFKADVLRGVHLVTGETLWTFATDGSHMRIPQTRNRPGPVFLLGRPSVGLDLTDGSVLWRLDIDHTFNQAGPDGDWFCGGADWISLCSTENGKPLWRAPLAADKVFGWHSVDTDAERAYVGLPHALLALDRATGRELWSRPDLGGRTCLVWSGSPYVFGARRTIRLDGATGKDRWTWSVPEGEEEDHWPWSGDDDEVFFQSTKLASGQQRFHAIDGSTGRGLWTIDGVFTDIWVDPSGREVWLFETRLGRHELVALSRSDGLEVFRTGAEFDHGAFCSDSQSVFVAVHPMQGSRVRVEAFDKSSWRRSWTIGLEHEHDLSESRYESFALERRGPLLVLIHEAPRAAWVDRIAPDTGETDRIFPGGK